MDTNRDLSLDALRGIAILGMVLSGSIAYKRDNLHGFGFMYYFLRRRVGFGRLNG